MVCPKCGVSNNDHSWRCRSCYTILRESTVSTDYSNLIVQSPLRQAQQPNLTPVDAAAGQNRRSRHAGGYPSQRMTTSPLAPPTIIPNRDMGAPSGKKAARRRRLREGSPPCTW